ncbi:MAG: phosphatase PAP2 family protein [Bacteroidota bacterium]
MTKFIQIKTSGFLVLILLITTVFDVNAQYKYKKDSILSGNLLKKSILPTTLIGAGLLINNSHFEKNLQTKLRNKVGNEFEYHIDDVTQYIPIVELYLADALKIEAKNHWFDQTKYLLISNTITAAITHGLKHSISKVRPNGSADNSFPSGHTSFAFTNATVLYNEFSSTSPLLAYSGYAFATTTGVFRMINNKHWFSDVLVGAGIGILVTNLVYYFEPLKSFNPFKNKENISLIPQIKGDKYGVYFAYDF